MNPSYKKIFWGFLLVLIEVHILVIDLLPDPIGFYLIYSGLTPLIDRYRTGNKAKPLTAVLIVISIPTVFLQQTVNTNQLPAVYDFSTLSIYMVLLEVVKLILVFYIFQLFMVIVKEHCDESLIKRTSATFKTYMVIMLMVMLSHSFMMNLTNDVRIPLSVASIGLGLIMEVVFLLLIRRIGKSIPDESGEEQFVNTTVK